MHEVKFFLSVIIAPAGECCQCVSEPSGWRLCQLRQYCHRALRSAGQCMRGLVRGQRSFLAPPQPQLKSPSTGSQRHMHTEHLCCTWIDAFGLVSPAAQRHKALQLLAREGLGHRSHLLRVRPPRFCPQPHPPADLAPAVYLRGAQSSHRDSSANGQGTMLGDIAQEVKLQV